VKERLHVPAGVLYFINRSLKPIYRLSKKKARAVREPFSLLRRSEDGRWCVVSDFRTDAITARRGRPTT
jgi:hypothetical protein